MDRLPQEGAQVRADTIPQEPKAIKRGAQEVNVNRLAILAQQENNGGSPAEIALGLLKHLWIKVGQQLSNVLMMLTLKHSLLHFHTAE